MTCWSKDWQKDIGQILTCAKRGFACFRLLSLIPELPCEQVQTTVLVDERQVALFPFFPQLIASQLPEAELSAM